MVRYSRKRKRYKLMSCYLSSSCFKGFSINAVFELCQKEGISRVELSAPHKYQPVDEIRSILQERRAQGFEMTLHNYFPPQAEEFVLNIASEDDRVLELSRQLVDDSMILSDTAQSSVFGIHAGYLADAYADDKGHFHFEPIQTTYRQALERAAKFVNTVAEQHQGEVALVLENLFPLSDKENVSLYCTMQQIEDLMSLVSERVGLLLDLGHLNVSAEYLRFNKYKFIERYLTLFGSRLYEVHLSENNGQWDDHLPLQPDSWQYEMIQEIETVKVNRNAERVYCLEARNTDGIQTLKDNLDLINKSLGKDYVISQ